MELLEALSKRIGANAGYYSEELKIPKREKMSWIQAHIALVQLKKIDCFNEQRNNNQRILNEILDGNSKITILKDNRSDIKCTSTWYVIRLNYNISNRSKFLEYCKKRNVYLSTFWDPIPFQQRKYNDLQDTSDTLNAIEAAKSTVVFRMTPNLSKESIYYICDVIQEVSDE